jgi:hypothetical protein
MSKNKTNNATLQSRSSRRQPDQARHLHPPPVEASIRVTRKQRFIASAAMTDSYLTVQKLSGLYQMAATATTGYPIFSAVKVLGVEMWGPPGTTSPVTVACEWTGGTFSSRRRVADTSIGSTYPAHIRTSTPEDILYSKWLDETGTTSQVFQLTGPAGTVVDITCEFMLRNGEAPPAADVIAGATPGDVYVQIPDSSGFLVPSQYTTF